ncbi:accessory gene regulator ArgB-like protein [Neomoorella mulderi]|uniref:Putative AgrB-like protein n=1 Tax=Moorella mulderi DSM 14980 TaxID=1122241 RepID=A0A151AY04_9FIRM|nr:accessory gene regulator B family protein [Moorella mulderi]KYH32528.1 putative AgrB-like protein [Moorella mulderi DSM 14980]
MLSIHQLAHSGAAYLVARLPEGQNKPQVEVVAFGLEVTLGASLQLITFVAVAWYLGLLPEMMAALITMATYRLLAGGVHCSAYYRCLILSLLTLVLLACLGRWLAGILGGSLMVGVVPVFAASLVIAWRRAPADTAAAPIINPVRRARLKKACYLWLVLWLAVVSLGYYLGWPGSTLASSLLALVFQGFALTPPGFAVVGRADGLLKRLLPLDKKLEGRR